MSSQFWKKNRRFFLLFFRWSHNLISCWESFAPIHFLAFWFNLNLHLKTSINLWFLFHWCTDNWWCIDQKFVIIDSFWITKKPHDELMSTANARVSNFKLKNKFFKATHSNNISFTTIISKWSQQNTTMFYFFLFLLKVSFFSLFSLPSAKIWDSNSCLNENLNKSRVNK